MNIDRIQPTPSVVLADEARKLKAKGIPVIELQTGDPDFCTHPAVVAAAHGALLQGHTHYSYSAGLPELRSELARILSQEFGSPLTQDNILVTHGAAQGISAILTALVELGDEVIILEPNWTTLDSMVVLAGGMAVKVSHLVEDVQLLEALERARTSRTKMLCFNSPNNPTGAVFSPARIKFLVEWAIAHDLFVLSDEVYRFLAFFEKPASVLNHFKQSKKLLFVDSFSKKFAMTGWRVGYVVGHPAVLNRIAKASQVAITHVAPFTQLAALEAVTNPAVGQAAAEMVDAYLERRSFLLKLCSELELDLVEPKGAFYLFIRLGEDDTAFAKRLLEDQFVCTVPGSAYGESGRGWLRVTFAAPTEAVERGLKKISALCHAR